MLRMHRQWRVNNISVRSRVFLCICSCYWYSLISNGIGDLTFDKYSDRLTFFFKLFISLSLSSLKFKYSNSIIILARNCCSFLLIKAIHLSYVKL